MSKAEDRALEKYPILETELGDINYLPRIGYLAGYHQAEKDLDISWVKEVSGVKDMSRAEEEALKAYPPQSIAANYDTISRRDAFEYGYLKAEKDLELTWEDISDIIEIHEDVLEMESCENVYMEVLRRFKERKKDESK